MTTSPPTACWSIRSSTTATRRSDAAPAPPGSPMVRTRAAAGGQAPTRPSAASILPDPGSAVHATHDVLNQVPVLADYDVADDAALLAAVHREGGGWVTDELHELGRLAGAAGTQEQARLANVYKPVLRSHDARGHRVDEVDFHPAWHQLLTVAVSHGLHAAPRADPTPGSHVARAAKCMVWTQSAAGHGCPVSMTYACAPALRHAPDLAARYQPLLTATVYEPGLRPPASKPR